MNLIWDLTNRVFRRYSPLYAQHMFKVCMVTTTHQEHCKIVMTSDPIKCITVIFIFLRNGASHCTTTYNTILNIPMNKHLLLQICTRDTTACPQDILTFWTPKIPQVPGTRFGHLHNKSNLHSTGTIRHSYLLVIVTFSQTVETALRPITKIRKLNQM